MTLVIYLWFCGFFFPLGIYIKLRLSAYNTYSLFSRFECMHMSVCVWNTVHSVGSHWTRVKQRRFTATQLEIRFRFQSKRMMRVFRVITCPPFSDINEPHLYWISIHISAESSNKKGLQVRNAILGSRSDSLTNPGSVSDKNGSVIHCCILHTVLRLLTPTHASCQIFSKPHSTSDVDFYSKC